MAEFSKSFVKPHKALVSCTTLNQSAMDFKRNAENIHESIRIAISHGSRLRIPAELEVTGYSCEDHFLEQDTLEHSLQVLAGIVGNKDYNNILIFVGMPVQYKNAIYNCSVLVLNGKIELIRPKIQLCNDSNYRESRYFSAGQENLLEEYQLPEVIRSVNGQKKTLFGNCIMQLKDCSLGIECCEELWQAYPMNSDLYSQGCEIVFNNSGSDFHYLKQQERQLLMMQSTVTAGGVYMYSNLRGCDGSRMLFDGCSQIIQNGQIIKNGCQFSFEDVEVTSCWVDLKEVRNKRFSKRQRQSNNKIPVIEIDFELCQNQNGQVIGDIDDVMAIQNPVEQIGYSSASYLWDYLRKNKAGGYFIALSGGADSAASALIIYQMCDILFKYIRKGNKKILEEVQEIVRDKQFIPENEKEICRRILNTAYLKTKNSSQQTNDLASRLSEQINSNHQIVDIDQTYESMVEQMQGQMSVDIKYKEQGGTVKTDLALQNVQSRLRMVYSYFIAQLIEAKNQKGFVLVMGSANLDEGLRGYCTKYDCSSADINVIGSFSKTDLKKYLEFVYQKYQYTAIDEIIRQKPSAELVPLNEQGSYQQTDEQDMGMTYQELSEFGQLRKIYRQGPVSMFLTLKDRWNHLEKEEVARKVKHFFRSYAINRHKTNVMTPTRMHAQVYGIDDNRFDLRPIFVNPSFEVQFKQIDELVRIL